VHPAALALDIADDTFVVAAPATVAAIVGDPASWRAWWPDLVPTVTRDRGPAGIQWSVRGALTGTMEIWLEPWGDGVIVHWYLRAEPAGAVRRLARDRAQRMLRWKQQVYALKDQLERGREPGSPRGAGGAVADVGVAGVKERVERAEST
jgi:hypothetical protein